MPDTTVTALAVIFGGLTWLLALSYNLGAASQRIRTLEHGAAETQLLLQQIWGEIRRVAEQADRLVGMHDAEIRAAKNP